MTKLLHFPISFEAGRQSVLMFLICFNSWVGVLVTEAAPQDRWLLDRHRGFGPISGMSGPSEIVMGQDGKVFIVEENKDRVQFLDQNQRLIAFPHTADLPRCGVYANGRLYVVSQNGRKVYVFDQQGNELFTFGSQGNGNGQFQSPKGIAASYLGSDLEIFVSDNNTDTVSVFDEFGAYKRNFWAQSNEPRDLAIDDNGSVYLADIHDKINVFDKNGTLLRTITGITGEPWGLSIHGDHLAVGNNLEIVSTVRIYSLDGSLLHVFGSYGTGPGQFKRPKGVAYDENGNLWVTDYGNHRIQVFDGNGTYLREFGGWAENPYMRDIQAAAYDDDFFYFTDNLNQRVVKLEANLGTYDRTIAEKGTGEGQVIDPKGINLDRQGRIYVVDSGNDRVQVFENNGTFIRSFGSSDIFVRPWGVAVADDGTVFVSDADLDKIFVFDGVGNLTGSWGESGSLGHELDNPCSLQIGPEGDLYVADYDNFAIKRFSPTGDLLLEIDLGDNGGSRHVDENQGSRPRNLGVRADGLIITCARNSKKHTFWVFDKFGNKLWEQNRAYAWYGAVPGVVAVNPRGYFLHYDGDDDENKYRRYLPTYRAGASIHSDALIPYPMLIRAKQEFQSSDLDIAYRVTDPDDSKVTTGMLAFIDGEKRFEKLIVPKSFIGPVVGKLGPNVDVNVTHSVSWDMAQDWNASGGNLKLEIFAKDNRELFDLHLVTIPADDTNATSLTINRYPLQDEDFLDAWHYLLATQDPGLKLENGAVMPPGLDASPISPSSFSGKLLWLDAADIDADGQPDSIVDESLVSVWKDKSGNDFNATQTNTINQPRYKDGALYPKLYFNDDWLSVSGANFTALQIFVVAQTESSTGYKAILSNGNSRGLIRTFHNSLRFENFFHSFAGSEGNYRVDGEVYDTFAQSTRHVLSVELGSDSENSGFFQNLMIGAESPGASLWKAYIHEIIIFDRLLTDEEEMDMEWYLGQKWEVYGPMPGGGYAAKSFSSEKGIDHLLGRMGLRRATNAEVNRALEATTPGVISKFDPTVKIQPDGNPQKINEFTIETQRTGIFVVPE